MDAIHIYLCPYFIYACVNQVYDRLTDTTRKLSNQVNLLKFGPQFSSWMRKIQEENQEEIQEEIQETRGRQEEDKRRHEYLLIKRATISKILTLSLRQYVTLTLWLLTKTKLFPKPKSTPQNQRKKL